VQRGTKIAGSVAASMVFAWVLFAPVWPCACGDAILVEILADKSPYQALRYVGGTAKNYLENLFDI
jgi:hypothetical protein